MTPSVMGLTAMGLSGGNDFCLLLSAMIQSSVVKRINHQDLRTDPGKEFW